MANIHRYDYSELYLPLFTRAKRGRWIDSRNTAIFVNYKPSKTHHYKTTYCCFYYPSVRLTEQSRYVYNIIVLTNVNKPFTHRC